MHVIHEECRGCQLPSGDMGWLAINNILLLAILCDKRDLWDVVDLFCRGQDEVLLQEESKL